MKTRHQKRARRIRQYKTALIDLIDAVWKDGVEDFPNIETALKEAQRQIDISEGAIPNNA